MTYQNFLHRHKEDIIFLLKLKYLDDEDEVVEKIVSMITSNSPKLQNLKKKEQKVIEHIFDIVDNYFDYLTDFIFMDIFYRSLYITRGEFYSNIFSADLTTENTKQLLAEEASLPLWKVPRFRLDKDAPALLTYEFCAKTYASIVGLTTSPSDEDVIEVCDFLQEAGYIKYKPYFGSGGLPDGIELQEVKDPYYNLRLREKAKREKEIEERTEPISISQGQDKIRDILYCNNIPFVQEYVVEINGHKRRFDFAIFGQKGIEYFIEFDGQQHFQAVPQWGGQEGLEERQKIDREKNQWVREQGKKLIRIPYTVSKIKLKDLQLEHSCYIQD